ncbi:c-type cytochrome [Methylobacterium symbioticum]|uniref:Cytochrome c-552 n=1 Tax=Methylobacterium symbioticum TaxID=2584084 RepID=A0A509E9U1_9HYPH|nr:cytochrome c family protein [Methylobacterium symbioticum]VUD70971.1 Cytochrome c-552 [Methylobacterium symbioticum]
MDSFELNKVAGAVLGALLFAAGSGFVAELIYHPKPAGKAGYDLPEPAAESAAAGAPAAKAEPIAVRLASANAEKGQGGTKACQACHSFEKGGPNKVGPDLWDVVERPKGGHGGFDYSAGIKEKGGTWTYEDLDHFLESPKGFIKGTKMAFAGIAAPQDRANVIAYLRTLSDSPKPLPAAEKAAEAKGGEAKAGDAKADGAKPAETKPADKPTADKPAAGKASEGKDSPAKPADTKIDQPVTEKAPGSPKPNTATENRNETAPKPAPESSGPTPNAPVQAEPAAPPAAPAKEAPAKADPAAEEKAKALESQGSVGGEPAK